MPKKRGKKAHKRTKRDRKVTPSLEQEPAISVGKNLLRLTNPSKRIRIVYFIRGNKPFKYPWSRSRILYIGKTLRTKGERPIESFLRRAPRLLATSKSRGRGKRKRGMREVDIVYLKIPPRKGVDIAEKLENACLLLFREHFGTWPRENHKGPPHYTDEADYFNLQHTKQILVEQLS
jgi:hypothetical protein